EYCFTPAAPGLNGVLIRSGLLEQLAIAGGYLGRGLNYWPDLPGRDPIALEQCAPLPTPLARTNHRFTLDSGRQIRLMEQPTVSLNGQLMETDAEQLVARLAVEPVNELLPRDVVLEINTARSSQPMYWPGRQLNIHREELRTNQAERLFCE